MDHQQPQHPPRLRADRSLRDPAPDARPARRRHDAGDAGGLQRTRQAVAGRPRLVGDLRRPRQRLRRTRRHRSARPAGACCAPHPTCHQASPRARCAHARQGQPNCEPVHWSATPMRFGRRAGCHPHGYTSPHDRRGEPANSYHPGRATTSEGSKCASTDTGLPITRQPPVDSASRGSYAQIVRPSPRIRSRPAATDARSRGTVRPCRRG